jgi:hypothetical protein
MAQPPLVTNFRDGIDLPQWRQIANAITTNATGMSMAYDMRGDKSCHPDAYYLTANTTFSKYHQKNNDWSALASPALAGTFGVGAAAIFHPSQGPRGTLASGTTTTVTLTTVLPAAVGTNQLANRGDGQGFRIRIIGNHAAGSGKTEEAYITANTSGTTPVITLDRTLSFTPASGDAYEIDSGRVFLLGAGANAAGQWKYYDIATNSYSGNLSVVNLPATIGTDSTMLAMSEAYVPYNLTPGNGMVVGASTYSATTGVADTAQNIKCLLATASGAATITGQASAGDAAVRTNQYRNFQIRIVEDTATPTSVGQRRNITSHTAGASAVYTVPAWTTTPSATAKFVIELNDNLILLWSSAVVTTFTYSISGDAWDASTTFASRGSAVGAGCKAEIAFGINDPTGNVNNGMIYSLRGGASSAMDVLDITAGTNGVWSNTIVYGNLSPTYTLGTSQAYDPLTNQGKYLYINVSSTQRNMRFDMLNRVIEPWAYLNFTIGTTIVGGEKSFCSFYFDPNSTARLAEWVQLRNGATEGFKVVVQR